VTGFSRSIVSDFHSAAEEARSLVVECCSVAMKVCSLASRTGFFVSQRHWAAANFDSASADANILKTRRSARSVKAIFGRQSPGCEELSVPHRVEPQFIDSNKQCFQKRAGCQEDF
jgi:hypothetical protein